MLAAIESLLSAVVAEDMIGARHDSDMELVGQGVGSAASALFGGIPATGPMFFGAADKIRQVKTEEGKNVVILRLSGVPAMEVTVLNGLQKLLETCKARNIRLLLTHVNSQPAKVLEKSGFLEELGRENALPDIHSDLERAKTL